jgi:hypothetical protein
MRTLDLDPKNHTAWAETGLTAAEYTKAADAHNLATGFGDTGSVGIGGLTLGGGIGYFARKYGLTIDDLLAADVVTADGKLLRVDANTHPDLFWAVRGGGGNVGVATRFQLRLHELNGVVGGMLILPATPDTIASFIAAAEAAPEELSTIANVMPAPPMPFVPAEYHGKLVILAFMCYAGSPDSGERALAPFRAIAKPLADMVKPIRYPEMYPPEDPSYHPNAVARTMFVDTIDRKRREDRQVPRGVRRLDEGARSFECSVAPWHACQPTLQLLPTARAESWSTWPRSTLALKTKKCARRGLQILPLRCAKATVVRTSTSLATRPRPVSARLIPQRL